MTDEELSKMISEFLPYPAEGQHHALKQFATLVAAAEREKLKHELLTLEKWKGMALAKDGDGRTVQEIEREAREAEREACAKVCDDLVLAHPGRADLTAQQCAVAIRKRGAP